MNLEKFFTELESRFTIEEKDANTVSLYDNDGIFIVTVAATELDNNGLDMGKDLQEMADTDIQDMKFILNNGYRETVLNFPNENEFMKKLHVFQWAY